jgi:hypothetical protein
LKEPAAPSSDDTPEEHNRYHVLTPHAIPSPHSDTANECTYITMNAINFTLPKTAPTATSYCKDKGLKKHAKSIVTGNNHGHPNDQGRACHSGLDGTSINRNYGMGMPNSGIHAKEVTTASCTAAALKNHIPDDWSYSEEPAIYEETKQDKELGTLESTVGTRPTKSRNY